MLLIGYALAMGVVTVTDQRGRPGPVRRDADLAARARSWSRSAWPASRPGCCATCQWSPGRWSPSGVAGHLAAYNTRRRAHLLAGVLAPVIVLTAAATSTLMVVGADGRTLPGGSTDESTTVNLLNNVVVGMVVLFAAVVVVNSFAAAIAHRRVELHRLWLLGATPRQVESSVLAEAGVVAVVGTALGTLASLASIVPFGIARHEGVVPDGQLWLPAVVIAAAVALTLLAARSAVRRAAPVPQDAAVAR